MEGSHDYGFNVAIDDTAVNVARPATAAAGAATPAGGRTLTVTGN